MGQPEDRRQFVGLLGRVAVGRLPTLPHGDDHQALQHGVGDARDHVDKAGDVVMLATLHRGNEVLNQHQLPDSGYDEQRNQGQAQNYADLDTSSLDARTLT